MELAITVSGSIHFLILRNKQLFLKAEIKADKKRKISINPRCIIKQNSL